MDCLGRGIGDTLDDHVASCVRMHKVVKQLDFSAVEQGVRFPISCFAELAFKALPNVGIYT